MKKILFITHHRMERSPGQRFRFEQYLKFLKENGYDYDFSYLLSEKEDLWFYSKKIIPKGWILVKSFLVRLRDVLRANNYDIIFVFREAHMLGTTFFEKSFDRSKVKVVFDFDDAIWLPNISEANKKYKWLKNSEKTEKIISLADMVFAGNKYLADYAARYNNKVKIVPTTIDTDEYKAISSPGQKDKICIGWSGSVTTIQHFEYALPFLKKLKEKYPDRFYVKVIGDKNYINKELDISGISWKRETEIKELSEIDIGIMPLPNDEWAKGKCGLKGLQYMALEIPTIMSPVGVNTEIIQEGQNGFLAATEEEWIEKLSLLIESEELRKRLGEAGRKTVEENYSVKSWQNKYIEYFNQVVSQ